jgi:hypothetical protein
MMQALIPVLALLFLNLADGAPSKYKMYGYGANADFYWQEDDCVYGSYLSIYAGDSVSKFQANGKPEAIKYPYVSTYFERWYGCSADSATHTYLVASDATPSASIVINDKNQLGSASILSTFEAYVVTEVCPIVCEPYEEWDNEYAEYCYPGECKQIPSSETAKVTLQATVVGTGNAYTSRNGYTDRGPYGFSRYKSSGRFRDATVSVSLTVDNIPIQIPSDADKSASIFKTTSGDISIYRNGY